MLAAGEPLPGRRLSPVRGQRTTREPPQLLQRRAAHYPDAANIRLVPECRNTPRRSPCDDWLPAAMARQRAERVEGDDPPKAASWLHRLDSTARPSRVRASGAGSPPKRHGSTSSTAGAARARSRKGQFVGTSPLSRPVKPATRHTATATKPIKTIPQLPEHGT